MFTVTDPWCVSTPPASKARIVMVRLEPDGMVTGPEATRSTTGMLNTSGVGMSAPVTSTTTVITAVAERSAWTRRLASTGRRPDPVGSEQAPIATIKASPIRRGNAAVTDLGPTRPTLRGNGDGRRPGGALEGPDDRRSAGTHRSHKSGAVDPGDCGVIGPPTHGPRRWVPVPIRDRGRQLQRSPDRQRVGRRRNGDAVPSQRDRDGHVVGQRRQDRRDRLVASRSDIERDRSGVRLDSAGIEGAYRDGPMGACRQRDGARGNAIGDGKIEYQRGRNIGRGDIHDHGRDRRAGDIGPDDERALTAAGADRSLTTAGRERQQPGEGDRYEADLLARHRVASRAPDDQKGEG